MQDTSTNTTTDTTISPPASSTTFSPAGIVLVDKPINWTSHDVVGKVRRLLGVKRVGHAGTLDPLATGLLIVLVGREYTKRQTEFLKQDKTYWCELELGRTTDTYDATGQEQTTTPWLEVSQLADAEIRAAVLSWQGVHQQQVPAFSAVKHKGRKLYQLARYEQESLPELPTREVEFYSFDRIKITRKEPEQQLLVSFEVACSSGTYIRSLVHDIGQQLGVGGTLTGLRRLQIGMHQVQHAIPPHLVSQRTILTNI